MSELTVEQFEILLAWEAGEISEGQASRAFGLSRVEARDIKESAIVRGIKGVDGEDKGPVVDRQIEMLRAVRDGGKLTREHYQGKPVYYLDGKYAGNGVVRFCLEDGLIEPVSWEVTEEGRKVAIAAGETEE